MSKLTRGHRQAERKAFVCVDLTAHRNLLAEPYIGLVSDQLPYTGQLVSIQQHLCCLLAMGPHLGAKVDGRQP